MVAHYFYVLEELTRDNNHKDWHALRSAVASNEALHTTCWKKYSAWTKEYNKEDWWWPIGEDHCKS